jgi:hypothetical protein
MSPTAKESEIIETPNESEALDPTKPPARARLELDPLPPEVVTNTAEEDEESVTKAPKLTPVGGAVFAGVPPLLMITAPVA